ncbi:ABC transporter ATP-binding protein [Breznakiella homolactica]|uniref:ATP-binding cassette domain-containing protein n=1 Tax=Breznakiella homolactica TaxID=2798577 RepID=A0A7T7XN23_9SPIR|nr:ATP-binding cassette domain-containing protein [Breznakiella homolactica]QQO09326.1 ATP-binding cassette domain-containing protein [Breznakiella homolactica]
MLELKNISFSVPQETGSKEILKNISLTIGDDRFLVITGPNGSGKSTLAKIIMGIEHPGSGSIIFNGEDITGWDVTQRAKAGIGFAFQQPVRFKGFAIKDLIELAVGKPLSIDEACVYLSEVGLCAKDYINREINASLSGGELKRVEIAMLIARGVKISLFDEPEAGIDLWSFQNLIRVFEKMRDRTKGAVVIISHQERILEIADTIVVLKGGEITDLGSRDTILPGLMQGVGGCSFHNGGTVF